jgi:hypothetical protein
MGEFRVRGSLSLNSNDSTDLGSFRCRHPMVSNCEEPAYVVAFLVNLTSALQTRRPSVFITIRALFSQVRTFLIIAYI